MEESKSQGLGYRLKVVGTVALAALTWGAAAHQSAVASGFKPEYQKQQERFVGFFDDSKKFNSSIDNLFTNPSVETADKAQHASMENGAKLYYLCSEVDEMTRMLLVVDYLDDSKMLLDGLKKVEGNNERVAKHRENIERRMDLFRLVGEFGPYSAQVRSNLSAEFKDVAPKKR
jgi:hypothetical protein